MPEASIVLRDSTDADIPAIARIYGHWVRHGLASFELEPPDVAEMAKRRAAAGQLRRPGRGGACDAAHAEPLRHPRRGQCRNAREGRQHQG